MSDLFISCACVWLCVCLFEMNAFVIVGHESNSKCSIVFACLCDIVLKP